MKFSVIIPTFHRNHLLEQCLLKLAPGNQMLSPESYEVIVTDDGNVTTAEQMIRKEFNWVRWIKGPGKGPASNRNNGAQAAKGIFVVFTDDDCLPDPEWLLAFDKALKEHPEVKVFEGRTYADTLQVSLSQEAPINLNGGKLFSCNLCIERNTFIETGGFDEDFSFSFEDMEFAHRIRRLRVSNVFVERAGVCHPWREVESNSWKNSMRQSKGICMFVKKHPDVLVYYNSFYFLKRLPISLFKELLPKFFKYRGRGAKVILVHSTHYLYMALRLFFPTLSVFVRRKI